MSGSSQMKDFSGMGSSQFENLNPPWDFNWDSWYLDCDEFGGKDENIGTCRSRSRISECER
jgi:hypothetical protein